jgi:hypothetical protein
MTNLLSQENVEIFMSVRFINKALRTAKILYQIKEDELVGTCGMVEGNE